VAGQTIEVTQKAGEDGRLFGSVTNNDIATALTAKGFEVAKSEVRLPEGPLKTTGEFPVSIALHHDVIVDVTVSVVAED
jgi:large subunit ribosomal protein L9